MPKTRTITPLAAILTVATIVTAIPHLQGQTDTSTSSANAREPNLNDRSPKASQKNANRSGTVDSESGMQGPPLFEVSIGSREGFINEKGVIAIKPRFDKVYPFTDGLAAVQIDGLWGFINTSGEFVIKPQFKEAGMFSDGRARIREHDYTDPWGYIDKEGRIVIEPQFDCAGEFRNGVARVGIQTAVTRLLSAVTDVGGECDYKYIDLNGKTISQPAPEHYATGKPDELILFKQGEYFGYVDASGKVRIPPQYVAASAFSEGLACVRTGDLYGFINKAGEFVIPPRFPYPNDFSQGLAGVPLEDGRWGFIDRAGKTVVKPRFSWIYRGFRHGIAEVALDGKAGYVDRNGDWVWRPSN